MNNLDKQYIELLQDILENGTQKGDRTGTGTISVFGRTIRHKMSEGFPLLTTKKMPFRLIATELIWFLRGDTNIKFLIDNNCHIWDGDAYKKYLKKNMFLPDPKWLKETKDGEHDLLDKDEFLDKIKTDDEFAKKWGDLGPVYGKQWREWSNYPSDDWLPDTIDQIANVINDLKNNPDSRRIIVSAWNVAEIDQMTLPPCHYGFQVYTRELSLEERIRIYALREGQTYEEFITNWDTEEQWLEDLSDTTVPTRAISLMWNQRSCDLPLGIPFNIASYGLLLEIIAKTLNMVPDELIGNLGDCHIYTNQIDGVKEQLLRESYILPTLNINTEFWPYESGSCGEGPLDAVNVFNSFNDDSFCKCLLEEDIQLANYTSSNKIHFPLSN